MLELDSHWFFGSSPEFVLIVAGIHVSEQSGIEIAHWMRVKLAKRPKPTRLGAIIIPEVFPVGGKNARTAEWKNGTGALGPFREKGNGTTEVFPARHFPQPGQPLSSLANKKITIKVGTSAKSFSLLPEIAYIMRAVETIKPVRIVSVHGKRPRTIDDVKRAQKQGIIDISEDEIKNWTTDIAIKGVNFQGIFVDPRYQVNNACRGFDVEPCKFEKDIDPAFPQSGLAPKPADKDIDPAAPKPPPVYLKPKQFNSARSSEGRKDDAIALAAAKAVAAENPKLVVGNHVKDPVPVVHYAKEGGTPSAFSLGDWGPVDVDPNGNAPGSRRGAPVFTIEVDDNYQSWAFLDGIQVMGEDGKPLKSELTPAERADGKKARDLVAPQKFSSTRSKELQLYAQAIIDTILELP